jgi:rhodanese-related sulfurtransferase
MKTVQAMLAEAEAEVPRISPDEAKGLLGRADVLFLDVREPAEVATSGKVPGALAVPRGLVEFRADPASAMHDAAFDRAKTVIAYCASGGRSALVGKTLKEMGYSNVRNLGGFKGWLEAGGEVEKTWSASSRLSLTWRKMARRGHSRVQQNAACRGQAASLDS